MNTVIISKTSGFSFKNGGIHIGGDFWTILTTKLAYYQRQIDNLYIDMRVDIAKDRVYLTKLSGGKLSIFGLGDPTPGKSSIGIVWAGDEKIILEALHSANVTQFYPYKVPEGDLFYVQDGELYAVRDIAAHLKEEREELERLIEVLEL